MKKKMRLANKKLKKADGSVKFMNPEKYKQARNPKQNGEDF